ncbi:integrating conjugative element protein [Vibrio sp. MACH09]|uniref:PFL_4669 family integrating conjugative element protein n=1 Tax=Vibrio sp. MACH09 TaxID=3025122 RepID=UPI00278D84A1|nr:TIGR03761 family integrating conjugative element protein [Vibrio sp. MACH09]GLO64108.1 integrating conjugative element protein [Vibrio sp. MACH09]
MSKNNNLLGGLGSVGQIELHSIESVRLWTPSIRRKTPTVGRFFSVTSVLEQAARQDDPYADFALLELENVMNKAFSLYTNMMEQLPSLVSSRIRFTECKSNKPMIKDLNVNTRFGWRMVSLLEMYDVLMVRLFDAKYKAQISRTVFEKRKNEAISMIHAVLNQSLVIKHSGITRQDVVANNAKAIEAKEKYGHILIPLEVMEGVERAEFAPEIKRNRSELNHR